MFSLLLSNLFALCLLNGGTIDNFVSVAIAPTMRPDEYTTLKIEMGHQDSTDGEFLNVLKEWNCPGVNPLVGIDAIRLDENARTTNWLVNDAANREALAELEAWQATQPVPKPESGLGILYYNNGWRQDSQGYWRSEDGSYTPWAVGHDATANSGNDGVAWSMPSNEFLDAPAPAEQSGWMRWFVSFCGTALVLLLVAGLLIYLGIRFLTDSGENDRKLAAKMAGGRA